MGDRWKSAWAPNPFRPPIVATVKILSIMTLRPLADVRTLMGHLPTRELAIHCGSNKSSAVGQHRRRAAWLWSEMHSR